MVKIVSDNPGRPVHALAPAHLTALVGRQLDAVDLFLHRLGRLANELAEGTVAGDADLEPFLHRWSFSASERRLLTEQLRRLRVLDIEPPWPDLDGAESASDVLSRLATIADRYPLPLP